MDKKCSGSKSYNKSDDEIPCLSSTTRRHVYMILHKAFDKAIEWQIIETNPLRHIGAPPKRNGRKKTVWMPDTFTAVLRDMSESGVDQVLRLAVHLAYACSTRIGEICTVCLSDINLANDLPVIDKTLQRVDEATLKLLKKDENIFLVFPKQVETSKSVLVLKKPKTESSSRHLYLLPQLKEEILARIRQIERDKEYMGENYHDFRLLLCLPNGLPIEPKLMEKRFVKYRKRTGLDLPEQIFHGIRYSSATIKLQLSDGDIKAVQSHTRHASAKVLVDDYAQMQFESHKKLAHKFGDVFYGEQIKGSEDKFGELLEVAKKDPQMIEKILNALHAQGITISHG